MPAWSIWLSGEPHIERNPGAYKLIQKGIINSMRDKLRTIHFVTAVLVLQIAYRITMLLRSLNY
jgi:hypothetical protein